MSKVMTMHQLQSLRNRGGLTRVERAVIIGERSPPLWPICRLVEWQYHVSVICLVMSFARGSLGFSITGSWLAYLFCICMMDMWTLLGWILHWHPRWLHRPQGYLMSERYGISARCWTVFILSLSLDQHSWGTWQECFPAYFSGVSMLPWWGSSCSILPVRADFHRYIRTIFAYWCTSHGYGWWTSLFSSIRTLRGWCPWCRGRARHRSIGAFTIMVWFSLWCYIS